MNKSKTSKQLITIAIAGLLCAVGLIIPLTMPKIVIGPMSFTLASHVPIFIAMFISLPIAIAVTLITAFGFLLSLPLVVALRALSHLLFVLVGAYLLKKNPNFLRSFGGIVSFAFITGVLHALAEVFVVSFFFFGGNLGPEYTSYFSVLLFVGVGTLGHSIVDFLLALTIWKVLQHIVKIPVYVHI